MVQARAGQYGPMARGALLVAHRTTQSTGCVYVSRGVSGTERLGHDTLCVGLFRAFWSFGLEDIHGMTTPCGG